MGEISKTTSNAGIPAPLAIPDEGPVVSRDEVVTSTASSTTITTVTKTHAEVDDTTGQKITRDTTTTVEKVERKMAGGVILIETTTKESWVKAEEGTLHFIESESTTTQPQPGSADKGAPAPTIQEEGHAVTPAPESTNLLETATGNQPPVITSDDVQPEPEKEKPPPYCKPIDKGSPPPSPEPPS